MRGLQRRWLVALLGIALVAVPAIAAPACAAPASAAPGPVPAPLAPALATPGSAVRYDAIRDSEYWLGEYGVTDAWQQTRGAGVTVAVIDTGIDGSHPDLAGAVVDGTDFSGRGSRSGQRPVSGEDSSHGTMVASLLAGRGRATAGIVGVAPEASLLSISIGFGDEYNDSDQQIADAVLWAVDHGADVINMSLTRNTPDWPRTWDAAFQYAMDNDVVIVAAAGNRGSGTKAVGAPATMPGVLTVAGLDRAGEASVDASAQGITIGVAAPSEQLVGAVPGSGYVSWNGSSGATPIVAGVVALVRAAHPTLDAADVINRVTATAREAGARGVDPIYGFGTVDADRAVTAKVAKVQANPMGDLTEWIRVHRRADADPAPMVTVTPAPRETGSAAGPVPAASGILPGSLMRDIGIPLALLAAFGAALIVLIGAARRHFGGLRRRE